MGIEGEAAGKTAAQFTLFPQFPFRKKFVIARGSRPVSAIRRSRRNGRTGKSISSFLVSKTCTRAGIVGTKMERSHGRVATAIALKSSRKNCELKARHFSTCCGHRRAISRSPLQLRPHCAIKRNSSFIIRASSLVGSCFIASRSKSREHPARGRTLNTSTHHDASICSLITRGKVV